MITIKGIVRRGNILYASGKFIRGDVNESRSNTNTESK